MPRGAPLAAPSASSPSLKCARMGTGRSPYGIPQIFPFVVWGRSFRGIRFELVDTGLNPSNRSGVGGKSISFCPEQLARAVVVSEELLPSFTLCIGSGT